MLAEQEAEVIHILERDTCSTGYRVQRIIRYVELNRYLVGQTVCQTMQQRTTAGQVDTAFHDVRIQLRRRGL